MATTKMTTKKMATKKTAKKKVAKRFARKAQDKKGPETSQHYDECTGIALSITGSQLRIVPHSEEYFTVTITVEGQSCRSMLMQCWDGQTWVNC